MKVIQTIDEWQRYRQHLHQTAVSVGFVPTMGNLHVGHGALLSRAIVENDKTVLSIYVNPLQFNDPEDHDTYPRTLTADLAMAKNLGVDAVLLPSSEEIYPLDQTITMTTHHPAATILEGVSRPGHFAGMLTIVLKLLLLVQPHRAYFGEKDYQQYCLIKDMATAYFLTSEIVPHPIVRDDEGLPYSSRLSRLDHSSLQRARQFAKIFLQDDDPEIIAQQLATEKFTVEYLELWQQRLFAAVNINGIRLIDNKSISCST